MSRQTLMQSDTSSPPPRGQEAMTTYWTTILIPAVNRIRKSLGVDLNDPAHDVVFFTDGEAQINYGSAKEGIASAIKAARIILGKLSASCSFLQQALDASPIFRDAKRELIEVTDTEAANVILEKRLREAFADAALSKNGPAKTTKLVKARVNTRWRGWTCIWGQGDQLFDHPRII
jgi:hypothetical protein